MNSGRSNRLGKYIVGAAMIVVEISAALACYTNTLAVSDR